MQNQNKTNHTTLIKYAADKFEKEEFSNLSNIDICENDGFVKWLNTYGIDNYSEFSDFINKNKLDDFLLKLLKDNEHTNKVIELEKSLFITIQVLKKGQFGIESHQMIFIASPDFLWSIQENRGDHFNWIIEQLENNKGLVRVKKNHYLLFLIIEAIIDNYQNNYEKSEDLISYKFASLKSNPTLEITALIENRKQELFRFKRTTSSLRDILVKLEKVEALSKKTKYFTELKEQAINLNNDIDFELQELEGKLNLLFSIQGYRLNEVMKTLTMFSVIFIPLTFLAGVYGMNFSYIPFLEYEYSYFILLGIMLVILILNIMYFIRKKWL